MKIYALLTVFLVSATFQDPPKQSKDDIKKALMEGVKKRLEEERTRILERVGKVIDEELSKGGGGASLADRLAQIEKRHDVLVRTLEAQLAAAKVEMNHWKTDVAIIEDAMKNGPRNMQQVRNVFQRAYNMIDKEAKYAEAADDFKKIYYMVSLGEVTGQGADQEAIISAYNIACAYGRLNEKEKSIDWLAISFGKGFQTAHGMRECQYDPAPHDGVAHSEHDPDLENVRDEPRFKEVLKPFSE